MSILRKLNEFVFGPDEDVENEGNTSIPEPTRDDFAPPRFTQSVPPAGSAKRRGTAGSANSNKVAYIHATTQLEVFIMAPETYDEAKEIIDHLKSKNAVVANLEKLGKETAQNVVDFIGGAVYALDANIQRVAGGTFLVAPYNVGITNDVRAELKSRGIFSTMINSV